MLSVRIRVSSVSGNPERVDAADITIRDLADKYKVLACHAYT
jgi:hypothetical protein